MELGVGKIRTSVQHRASRRPGQEWSQLQPYLVGQARTVPTECTECWLYDTGGDVHNWGCIISTHYQKGYQKRYILMNTDSSLIPKSLLYNLSRLLYQYHLANTYFTTVENVNNQTCTLKAYLRCKSSITRIVFLLILFMSPILLILERT